MSRLANIWRWRRSLIPLLLCVMIGFAGPLSACSTNSPSSAPIPDSTFSRLLVELHLLASRGNRVDGSLPSHLRDSLFEHYETNREEFTETLRRYSHHPSRLKSLYRSVIDTLRALEQKGREQQYGGKGVP